MHNKNLRLSLILMAALASGAAQAFDMAVGLKGGTLGAGVEATIKLHDKLNLRASAQTWSETDTFEEDGIHYNGDMDLQTLGLLLDWHPFSGSFRVSAGALSNGNEFKLQANCNSPCEIDNARYVSDALNPGKVDAKVEFASLAPYAGIGWGNAMRGGKWYVALDLGVLFQDTPEASMNASGAFRDQANPLVTVNANNPVFQARLKQEESNLQDSLSEFDMYPVLNLALGYRF